MGVSQKWHEIVDYSYRRDGSASLSNVVVHLDSSPEVGLREILRMRDFNVDSES